MVGPGARQKNVLSQSAYLFTLSNYQSSHATTIENED